MCSLRDTQPLPAIETMADLHRDDPERVYTHRRDTESVAWTDADGARHSVLYVPRRTSQWSQSSLDRLLADVRKDAQ